MRRLLKGFLMSLSMFSIIPLPKIWDTTAFTWVMPSFPVVGFVIGLLWYGTVQAVSYLNIPLMLQAALIFLFPALMSGFIHVDGYMDTADAIYSRAELAKKQAILADPHVGAFAVIMLGVYLLVGFAAVYSMLEATIAINPVIFIFIPILSRNLAGIVLLMAKPMKPTGFGAIFRENTKWYHILVLFCILGLSILIGLFVGGMAFVYAFVALMIGGFVVSLYVIRQMGGISGDLCGFIITVSELFALLVLAITVS